MSTEQLYTSLLDWGQAPTTVLFCAIVALFWLKCKQSQLLEQRKLQHSKDCLAAISSNQDIRLNGCKQLPTPPPMPIIGHMYLLRDYQENPWDGFDQIKRQYGDLVALKMGVHSMVLVSSQAVMKEILLDKGTIFSDRPNFQRYHIIFGGDRANSLALCDWSRTHRDRRKMCKRGIVPNKFSSRNQLLESIVCRLAARYVDRIASEKPSPTPTPTRSPSADPNSPQTLCFSTTKLDLCFLTSDIFMEFLCGESRSHSEPRYREFVESCDFIFWDINQSHISDFIPYLTPLGLGRNYLKKLQRITDYARDYIDDEIFDPRHQRHRNASDTPIPPPKDSSLEHGGPDESNEDYLDSIITEFLSDTTSMSLADYKVGFADLLAGNAAVANIIMRLLGHLALHPDVQEMIFREAEETDLYNLDYKPSLPITEACVHETLRLASSPIVPHVAREDTTLDQFFVPKGTMVLFNIYSLNLSENLWPNPRNFDPLRFVETNSSPTGEVCYKFNSPKHFMPFSAGLRQCLGHKMVQTTSIITVANLCKKFIIKANSDDLVRHLLTPRGTMALNPEAECYKLKLYPR